MLNDTQKVELVDLLVRAGLTSIEVGSFVSPRAVPQMADTENVLTAVHEIHAGIRASVLVPNAKGLERAAHADAREISVVLSATETMNRRNINMGLEEAARVCDEVTRSATQIDVAVRAYIAVAIECPFEGLVSRSVVVGLAERLFNAGAHEIVLADTIGAASPAQVKELLQDISGSVPVGSTSCHFHDTRGFGVANAWAALNAGIRRFDSSAGGIGGCPFAPGAAGNVAAEDLVLLAEQSGLKTGVSLEGLSEAVALAEHLLGRHLGGNSMSWFRRRNAR